MISTILGLFSNPFFDLLGNPKFWLGAAIVVILGFLIFICIKYPKGGLPVLAGVFTVGLACLDAYCIIQLNLYYNAEGGIHGYLTGIFDTNKVDVVDYLTFDIKNIELTEASEGVYSASITTDQVLSLDTKESLGIFVNGMPCDTTSEVHSDFAIAQYPYIFYDNDKSVICTDTLILNIAFYENSTYLNLSTKGGTLPVEECVKYWHHYFNKNGFVVKVAPFNSVSTDLEYTNGDTSNCSIVKYYLDGELYQTKAYLNGSQLELPMINDSYCNWYVNDEIVDETYVVNQNLIVQTFTADILDTYEVAFVNGSDSTLMLVSEKSPLVIPSDPIKDGWTFVGWSTDETSVGVVDVDTYELTSDVTFTAMFSKSVFSYDKEYMAIQLIGSEKCLMTLDFQKYCSVTDLVNSGYEFKITCVYKRTINEIATYFDVDVRSASGSYLIEDTNITLPYVVTATDKLIFNTADGKNASIKFADGQHQFRLYDIEIYTK